MKSRKLYRKTLLVFGGIFFLGVFLTHFRYLILLTNDIVPDIYGNAADGGNTLEDVPTPRGFKMTAEDFSRETQDKKIASTLLKTIDYGPSKEAETTTIAANSIEVSTGTTNKHPNKMKKGETPSPPFFQDTICGGCRTILWAKARGLTCGSEMNMIASTENITMAEAAVLVVQKKTELCLPCLPESCTQQNKAYWRYDAAAPKILSSKTHYMPSVSAEARVPAKLLDLGVNTTTTTAETDTVFKNLENYFSLPANSYPRRQYLFDYNPSIVQLPLDNYQHLQEEYPNAVYLASFRLSNLQSCFPTNVSKALIGGNWDQRPEAINLLGLALLDQHLNMIQDVVVKIPDMFVRWVDYRLFVIEGQIYLTSNCQMVPLWINPKLTVMSFKINTLARKYFSSPLEVAVKKIPAVCSQSILDLQGAKNLNYFVDANGQPVVEYLPSSPRVLRHFDPTLHDIINGPNPKDEYRDESIGPNALPPPSFYTREELDLAERRGFYGQPFTSYRGSACCVSIEVPPQHRHHINATSTSLLMGIVHVKTPFGRKRLKDVVTGNHYLSRFYAFEPIPPYRIVANSGYFCLPANPGAAGAGSSGDPNNNNPLAHIPTFQPLEIGDTVYDCPAIHFVTGLVDKVNDPTRLFIGYGVQDCTSWFIEVDKNEVIDLLFAPPKQNKKAKTRQGKSNPWYRDS